MDGIRLRYGYIYINRYEIRVMGMDFLGSILFVFYNYFLVLLKRYFGGLSYTSIKKTAPHLFVYGWSSQNTYIGA